MRANVVRIGNSRGVRIPKSILAACAIEDVVRTVDEARLVRRVGQLDAGTAERTLQALAELFAP